MARGPLRISRTGPPAIVEDPALDSLGFALFNLPGGKRRLMDFVCLAARGDARLQRMAVIWDQLSRYKQERLRLEDLCAEVAIPPEELLRAVFAAETDVSQKIARLAFAADLPKMVKRLAQSGCGFGTPNGIP
jgi:hypothetical protein